MRALKSLYLLTVLMLCCSCSGDADPETEIRQAVAELQQALESGNNADFRQHLAESFLGGHEGRRDIDRDEVRAMLAGYFLRYRNIGVVIPTLQVEVDEYEPSLAYMRGTAGLSGGNARLPETAKLYTFEGQWRYLDSRWQLIQFSWQ